MLLEIKKKSGSWIVKAVLIVISLSFVLWGTSSIWNIFISENVLLEVNEDAFSSPYFERQVSIHKETLIKSNLETTLAERYRDTQIRELVLDSIINATLIRQAAEEDLMALSERQIDRIIVNQAEFHVDGKFNSRSFTEFLKKARISSSDYRAHIGNNFKINTYSLSVDNSAFFTPQELDFYANWKHQEYNYHYLQLDPQDFVGEDAVSEDLLRAFYEEEIEKYYLPPKYSIKYYIINPEDFLDQIEVGPEPVRQLYNDQYGAQLAEANVTLRQIFIADESGLAQGAEEGLEDLKQQIKTERDFIRLAREKSEDEQTKESGGLLGETQIGSLPASFADALLAATKQQRILGPLRTDLGVHLLWIAKRASTDVPALEEVREDLELEIRYSQIEDFALERTEALSFGLATGKDLDTEAASQGITGGKEQTFSLDDEFPQEFGSVLINEVLAMNQDETSDVLFLEDGRYLVFALQDKQDEKIQLFNDVAEQVEEDYRLFVTAEKLNEIGKEVVHTIGTGDKSYVAALELLPPLQVRKLLTWQEELGVSRADGTDRPGAQLVLSLKRSNVPYGGARVSSDGKLELVVIDGIIAKTYANLPEADKRGIRNEYLEKNRRTTNFLVLNSLRDRAQIEVNEDLAGVR